MNNIAIDEMYESSSYEGSEDSLSDEELLSSNIGIQYAPLLNENEKLLDDTKKTDYEEFRNKYFTPEITKRRFTYLKATDASPDPISLSDKFNLETKNIIGFKLIKSGIETSADNANIHVDLIIPEIPDIACMKNEKNESIIDRLPLYLGGANCYHYDDYKNDIYFNPITLDTLTLTIAYAGYLTFEVSYLNI
jgi:hypothetical protein